MSRNTPRVFISSTSEDLGPYRSAAKEAALQAGFHPEMMEYFAAQSQNPPYATCMNKIDPCDVLIVIVAHRYGWVPPDQPGEKKDKSITWLECERAQSRQPRTEVITFLVDEKPEPRWPLDLYEAYRSTKAIEDGTDTPELIAEVRRNVAKLKEFKQWLSGLGTRRSFSSPKDLKGEVLAALYEWRDRHPEFRAAAPAPQRDPEKYIQWLRTQTTWIDIRGLQVGAGKAHRIPIGDLYIPLKTIESGDGSEVGRGREVGRDLGEERKPVLLEEALRHKRLVIVGLPGSGKSTFLRRIAYELCRPDGQPGLQVMPGFPILIRIAALEEHIRSCRERHEGGAPTTRESPAWLVHFLEYQGEKPQWELDADFFERKLGEDSTCVLLDGLDEAVNRVDRESMARLLEGATSQYGCRFVVTTRPGSYQGRATLAGFAQAQIDDLEDQAIDRFLKQWSQNLYPADPEGAEGHYQQLLGALRARPEISLMARNPMMLTALAMVHWNEKRLPEQRADLYESILNWLARSREQRPGRERADACLDLLAELALAMQSQPEGRLTQVSLGQAAEMIAGQWREVPEIERFHRAQAFLAQEELDSGIVDIRGADLRFRHLTFQEFLAARAIAGLADTAQQKLLLAGERLHRTEWREVMLLLAGILLVKQGRAKVDGLFRAVLESLADNASLAKRAQCAGLLGAMLRDLQPLGYQPADPRYDSNLKSVLPIFEKGEAEAISLQIRMEAAEAIGQAGDPRLRPENDNWVTIPAGKFLMGAQKRDPKGLNYDAEADDDEFPVHEVWLPAFQIGRYPVTVEEYRRFMEDDGYRNEAWWKAGGFGERTEPENWVEQRLYPGFLTRT